MSWFNRVLHNHKVNGLLKVVTDSKSYHERNRAFQTLQSIVTARDAQLLRPLISALATPPTSENFLSSEPNYEVAQRAATLLGKIGGVRARDALIGRLKTGAWSSQFAIAAAYALKEIGDPQAAAPLADILSVHQNDGSRTSLVETLAALRDPVAIPVLKTCLANKTVFVRAAELPEFHGAIRAALRVLGGSTTTPEEDLVNELVEVLDLYVTGKAQIYEPARAAQKLGRLALPELRRRIESGQVDQVRVAVMALGGLAADVALALVEEASKSPHRQVQVAVAEYRRTHAIASGPESNT
jgi:HEAT repeat protein